MKALRQTPFSKSHHSLKARFTDFTGWEMPAWYTSILEEHRTVRAAAGMFDVSDMGRVWLTGGNAGAFLDRVLTAPVQQLKEGAARLCLLCLEDGGILDDLWIYRLEVEQYLLVWNAGNIEEKLGWLHYWAGSATDIIIEDKSAVTAMLAVQGPSTYQLNDLRAVQHLPRFGHAKINMGGVNALASRTGYTGEDGFEIIVDTDHAIPLWESFIKQGVKPCGLGARDSLRLEAGMLLYGNDMDATTNPFEAGLGWLVDLESRDFVGREALLRIKHHGISRKLVGFQMSGREIARSGYTILKASREVGKVTSGGYAPTLGINIGLGYVPIELSTIGTRIEVMIRNKPVPAHIVDKRFYHKGG